MQKDNAVEQIAIADQHCAAEKLEAKVDKLNAMGHALEATVAEIKGDTLVVQRGEIRPPQSAVCLYRDRANAVNC